MKNAQARNVMSIEIASHGGFCFGVKRAIKVARETRKKALRENPGSPAPVYTFGSLVHNPQVTGKLENEGIISISSIDGLRGGYVIIRSHGAPPEFAEQALQQGLKVIDATCPHVKKIHRLARRLRSEGYRVVIAGHRNHPEVIGIMGYSGDDCLVIESCDELAGFQAGAKIGLVVQTTAPRGKFVAIASALVERTEELRIFNTICFETSRRQVEAGEMARRSDLMIVVGGRNRSTTRRLMEICQEAGTSACLVETPLELDPSWFKEASRVGITSGASTPVELAEEVKKAIEGYGGSGGRGFQGKNVNR